LFVCCTSAIINIFAFLCFYYTHFYNTQCKTKWHFFIWYKNSQSHQRWSCHSKLCRSFYIAIFCFHEKNSVTNLDQKMRLCIKVHWTINKGYILWNRKYENQRFRILFVVTQAQYLQQQPMWCFLFLFVVLPCFLVHKE